MSENFPQKTQESLGRFITALMAIMLIIASVSAFFVSSASLWLVGGLFFVGVVSLWVAISKNSKIATSLRKFLPFDFNL